MAQMTSLVLLALAVSLDSFSVGFTYGLRKMKIPIKSIFIIACCSGSALFISALFGKIISSTLSPDVAETVGGAILMLIGIWVIFQFLRSKQSNEEEQHEEKILVKFEIKSIGLVVQILKKPMSADFDRSGTITGVEAFMLGAALSLDATGAGIGSAMLGISPVFLAVTVAVMSSLFLIVGLFLGTYFSNSKWVQTFSFIPGLLLICIGLWKI